MSERSSVTYTENFVLPVMTPVPPIFAAYAIPISRKFRSVSSFVSRASSVKIYKIKHLYHT